MDHHNLHSCVPDSQREFNNAPPLSGAQAMVEEIIGALAHDLFPLIVRKVFGVDLPNFISKLLHQIEHLAMVVDQGLLCFGNLVSPFLSNLAQV